MNVDLELYRVFYTVAKHKHMTKASEELHISQPAISQSIKKLEDQIGGTLFLRSNKGMDLTSEGKMFYEYVKGRSYYLLFYFGKFGNIKKFSQENLAQQFEGKSIIAAISSTIHKENICTQYETLFKEINYHGFVMVELRKNHTGYYMIEANPRFWGPSQLLINCNTAFFEEFLYDYGFLKKCYQKSHYQPCNTI